jgi:FkbM family methyltransferase
MNLLARPWVIKTRNRLRTNVIARAVYERWMASFAYEERFGAQLLATVDTGSIVWDVGANVGLYTGKFLAKGARTVVCVEPAPAAIEALRHWVAAEPSRVERVQVLPVALSDIAGCAPFIADGSSVTNQLGADATGGEHVVQVRVARADELIGEQSLPIPTVIKIDVEGYELEVLRGFGEILKRQELRAVFVEVHFSRLHSRGLEQAADEICQLLAAAGLTVRWLDLSHLCALR